MATIRIEYKNQQVRDALNKLLRAGTDLSPVMKQIAGHLAASTQQSFEREAAPDGTPWAKLSPVTVAQRIKKRGSLPVKILEDTGQLQKSILEDWDSTSAEVGTITEYATTHQFGASKGQFGRGNYKTKKGSFPIPWGNIPARPFLGVAAEQERQIQQDVLDFIAEQWR